MRENFKYKIRSIDVITLDVHERVSAFIWSREVLPFDCVKILSVPKPIGGILVFSVNALFFLNQGIPPYAVSLNSLGDAAMEGIASKYLIFLKFKAKDSKTNNKLKVSVHYRILTKKLAKHEQEKMPILLS